ncbi:MAG: hypothetical protein U0325_32460 [Polyangiales bacterium]
MNAPLLALCLAACGGTPATTPQDAATAPPDTARAPQDAATPLSTICNNLRRQMCAGIQDCERAVLQTFGPADGRCTAQSDAVLRCLATVSATSCISGTELALRTCATVVDAYMRCSGPIDAGGAADAPSADDVAAPPDDAGAPSDDAGAPSDAGVAEDTAAADAGGPACPNFAGRYTATTTRGETALCPGGVFTLTRNSAGGACRFGVTFQPEGMATFTLSNAHVDVDMDSALSGEGTVTDRAGTHPVMFMGSIDVTMGVGALTMARGTDPCGWLLMAGM